MDNQVRSPEEQMMEALSMGMYGRPSQNRCSILNHSQRESLKIAAMEMVQGNHRPTDAKSYPATADTNSD